MGLFDIAEVARRSGIPASALRYYEERGLIESVGRHGLRRTFHAQVFKRGDRHLPAGLGWPSRPGLWTVEQVAPWRSVTHAIHQMPEGQT